MEVCKFQVCITIQTGFWSDSNLWSNIYNTKQEAEQVVETLKGILTPYNKPDEIEFSIEEEWVEVDEDDRNEVDALGQSMGKCSI